MSFMTSSQTMILWLLRMDIFVYFQHFVLFFINLTEQGEKCSTSPARQLVYTQLLN